MKYLLIAFFMVLACSTEKIDTGAQDANINYDADGDGYGKFDGDCDDTNATIHLGALEICNNGVDDDCDGRIDQESFWYDDADNDGYGNPNVMIYSCSPIVRYVTNGMDCDDTDSSVNPDATEVCNSVDDNCDGVIDEDEICNTE